MPTAPEARGYHASAWCRRVGITPGRPFAASLVAAVFILTATGDSKVRAADTALNAWNGERLPPFARDTLNGGRTDLAQFRGRVVLVHFFATWCEPCRAEFASLQQLVGRMRPKPITVVAVDGGEADRAVQRFFATPPVPFPILLDRDRAVAKAWHVYALPTTFLLDGDLIPRFVAEGDFDWSRPDVEDALTSLFASEAADAKATLGFALSGFDQEFRFDKE